MTGRWMVTAAAIAAYTGAGAQEAGPAARPVMTTTVGIEGKVVYRWSGPTLRIRALGPRSTMLVRLADVQTDGESTLYDLRFIALKPGLYDVREWLERVDGVELGDEAPAAAFRVDSTLAADDSGELRTAAGLGVPALGGYRNLAIGLGVVWVIPMGVIAWRAAMRRPRAAPVAATDAPLTLADQLRPLVTRALSDDAEASDRANLERVDRKSVV